MCIGDGCGKPDVTPAGSIVTVTTMGQHKDMGYPRVKLHDANGEQVINEPPPNGDEFLS